MQLNLFHFIVLAFALFAIGTFGVLTRKNIIVVLMSLELLLNAVNVLFVAFNRFHPELMDGQIFALLVITIAAIEAAVGLALVIALYRLKDEVTTDQITEMKG
jgi:NADH:ubiquinone oxidoreductase subunit K